uniref:DNA-directed RNA polymerase n=1 Tax=Neotessella volvocina TaxID=52559 RepID=A0A3G2R082_9STRA|nr:RNA polymerase beta'' subunit [Neotessella volvocina]
MLITQTVTKKILETIVHETFTQFGILSSSSLLDSLKLLGFYYATNAGISINIEDLRTPEAKKKYIEIANKEIEHISEQWQQGFVSDIERFQNIIDNWNLATESLKNKIIDYYERFDPANNLYIMAFSGARGNMSQVRQLVGMRGLMSDQEGKIIDIPIQTNFREGLSSIDYIISSYGARKGIVDTALKTADSGYLTRRLIYIAQDLVIREQDCKTKQGVLFVFNKNSQIKNLIGRTLISARKIQSTEEVINQLPNDKSIITLNKDILNEFRFSTPLLLNVRSPLTCKSNGSICQKCYGWDLAQNKLVALGEAIGIIAAQSIGEPGTQLTMRTFHTGGIFTGETLKQIFAPFSGKILIPSSLKTISYRTNHGILVAKVQQESKVLLRNWEGKETDIFLSIGTYLYISNSSFVKEGQLIAEYSIQSLSLGTRKLKPVYTMMEGEIRFENLLIRKITKDNKKIKVNQDDSVLWITSGKIFSLPKEIDYLFPLILDKNRPFALQKIVSPYSGKIELFSQSFIIVLKNKKKYSLSFFDLTKKFPNCIIKFSSSIKTIQHIDKFTILGFLYFFPLCEGKIYSLKKKETKYIKTYFCITESDVWKINNEQVNNISFLQDNKNIVRPGNSISNSLKFSRSGFFLYKDGFKMIFQNATPIFLSRGTILNYKQGDFVFKNQIFATLINYTQQTEDIVQGLPKIEELIEARKPKLKAYLSNRPGIILNNSFSPETKLTNLIRIVDKNIIRCIYNDKKIKRDDKEDGLGMFLGHSIYVKPDFFLYRNSIFKISMIPSGFKLEKKKSKNEYVFKNYYDRPLIFHGKNQYSNWIKIKANEFLFPYVFRFTENGIEKWLKLNSKMSIFQNFKQDYIIQTSNNEFLFLEYLNPVSHYMIPFSSKYLFMSGMFVDIGEPITEGIIDAHELLNIFFNYHLIFDGRLKGIERSLSKFQLILVNSIQAIYQSQGVDISSKHIEIIVKQMTSKVVIKDSGDTPLLPGELIRLSFITEIYKAFQTIDSFKKPKFEPVLLSASNCSLNKDGFLSPAGFQETKRVLTKAAIEGSVDWLRGLKECIILGRLIPAGSAFLNYKNYLDTVYLFKEL